MGDLKASEAYTTVCRINLLGTNTGVAGLSPTCTAIKAVDDTRSVCVVTELSNGWYKASFTNDAAGTWMSEWAVLGSYTIYGNYQVFKVGGGRTEDINTALTVVDGLLDVAAIDVAANSQMRDVVGNKSDTVSGTSLVAIAKQIKAKTDNLPSDPGDESDLLTAINLRVPTTDIAVPTADAATNVNMRDVVGNKSDTVAGTSIVALIRQAQASLAGLNNITAASVWAVATRTLTDYSGVWSVATRALTDKAGFTISGTKTTLDALNDITAENVRLSVCLTGDTASSIGKILFDLYARITGLNLLAADIAVPVADVATNTNIRDAIGNKNDTVAGTSLVAIGKQVKAKTDLIPADCTTQLDTNVPAIKTMTDKIGTVVNTGGTASLGAILGDPAASNIVALLAAINTALTFQQQADATIAQNNPVSLTKYTVLDTTANVRIISIETDITWATTAVVYIKIYVTIDGRSIEFYQSLPTTGTPYFPLPDPQQLENSQAFTTNSAIANYKAFLLEGRSVKVEAQVSWNTTQPTPLNCRVKYAKR
jgi:hypothetical protein